MCAMCIVERPRKGVEMTGARATQAAPGGGKINIVIGPDGVDHVNVLATTLDIYRESRALADWIEDEIRLINEKIQAKLRSECAFN